MNTDVIFSDDVNLLRQEIVRLRTMFDSEYRVTECYRTQNEHLRSIIESFINHDYGKSI